MSLCLHTTTYAQCHGKDFLVLKTIFENNREGIWFYEENWAETFVLDSTDTNCNLELLYGVKLNDDGRVIELLLPNNNLTGELTDSIGQLEFLEILMLNGNNLEGELPSSISNLKHLKVLRLFNNAFDENILITLLQLTNLEELDLGINQFTGELPNVSDTINELINLRHFLTNSNQLSGSIPLNLGYCMPNLVDFWINDNNLYDSIPFKSSNDFKVRVDSNFLTFKNVKDHYENNLRSEFYSPQFNGIPQIQTVAKNGSITLDLSESLPNKTSHTDLLNYAWFKGDSLVGTDSVYTIINASVSDIGIYTVRISDEAYVSGLEVISMPIDLRLEGYDENGNRVVPRELIVKGELPDSLRKYLVKSCGCNGGELHLLKFDSEKEANEKLAEIDSKDITLKSESELDGGIKNNIFGREIIIGDLPVYKYKYTAPNIAYTDNLATVRIYILDTGLNYSNDSKHYAPYLTSTLSCYGYNGYGHNFASDNSFYDFGDDVGHGTFGFRTIVKGIDRYFNLEVIPIRVFDESGRGTLFDFICALNYSVENGGDIVNFSGGLKGVNHPIIEETIEYAKSQNTTIVCAAGNHSLNIDSVYYAPAHYSRKYKNVIPVASIDTTLRLSTFSNFGNSVMLAAYGEHVEGYSLRQDCVSASGTSISTFFVTRALAIELAKNKDRTCDELIEDFLKSEALIELETLNGITSTGKYLNMGYKKLTDEDACCQSPQVNFRIDTTCHTATLTWDDNFLRSEYNYEIKYREKGKVELSWENDHTTNTEYVIENLKEDTEYEFIITSICGSENGAFTGPLSFTTKRVEDCGLQGEAFNTFDLLLYPNPVKNSLNFYIMNPIEMDNTINVQIFDNTGRALLNSEFFISSEGRTFYVPTNSFASGMYYVNFVSGDYILTKKIHIIR